MPLKIAMTGAGSIEFIRRLMADLLAVPKFAGTRSDAMRPRKCALLAAFWLCAAGIAPALSHAQTPPAAPVIHSGARLFALGSPHSIGAIPRVYGVHWRKDGGAFVFFGLTRPGSLAKERQALQRGEKLSLEDEPNLLVYDLNTARVQTIGQFQTARDKEYFLEAEWVGQDLCVQTGVPATKENPQPDKRLYWYEPKTANARLLAELPAAITLEASHEDASFLMVRYIDGDSQRFCVVAEGKVIPLKLGNGIDTFGLQGWSLDGKAYYVHGERADMGATALEVRYEAGEVKIKKVDFNYKRDFFAAQEPSEPVFTLRCEKAYPAPSLVTLVGKAVAPQAKDVPSTRCALALSSDSNDDYSLSPDSAAVIYVAQETLFVQRIVELKGKQKEAVPLRLKPNK